MQIYEELRLTNYEGAVFKEVDAPFSPGRPNSDGAQLKYKFIETASFIVTARDAKRSVTLARSTATKWWVPATSPSHPTMPCLAVGEVVECRYLHAFRESGSIYQPVYLGKRCDIPAAECTTDQFKYKTVAEAAA